MKKNVTVTATNGGFTVELTAKINAPSWMRRSEVNQLADDLRDRLMQQLPGLKWTGFRLSKVKVK